MSILRQASWQVDLLPSLVQIRVKIIFNSVIALTVYQLHCYKLIPTQRGHCVYKCYDKEHGEGRLTARGVVGASSSSSLSPFLTCLSTFASGSRLIPTDVYLSTESKQGSSGSFGALLSPFLLDYSFAVVYSKAPEPALGSWETLCRDKLTLSSEERVSVTVNHLPLPYLAFSSASLVLLPDYSEPQEMRPCIHFTGSLCLTICDILGSLSLGSNMYSFQEMFNTPRS